jgi:hypothetical protein
VGFQFITVAGLVSAIRNMPEWLSSLTAPKLEAKRLEARPYQRSEWGVLRHLPDAGC